ncbi:IclR family transcriptional regulator [Catenulispora yoronensis]|uniref:IclR family transcriptional regulator n=1 Tax=Catenulispora yoronensis TaxID=450799 RepID=A0ABN2UGW0_9ACTN
MSEDNAAEREPSSDARQGIQSVELAMLPLRALEEGRGPMSLTQVAAASGMQPSKVHRYLVSLARVGLIARSPTTGLYDLGPAMRRLGVESLRRLDEVSLVTEHLPELRERTGHAVNLAVWGDHGPVIVRWEYGAHALPITVRVGATMPLLNSAVGLAYLAHLPETLTAPVLSAQADAASSAVPDTARLAALRAEVLDRGFALTTGGVIPGVTSLAAPVFGAGDSLPLVVALAMPSREAPEDQLPVLAAELLNTARAAATDLGNPPV